MASLLARNTAELSENKIHDDKVAAAYGFRGGLVPGVTVYGYLASEVLKHMLPNWLEEGSIKARFYSPFYEGDPVIFSSSQAGDELSIDAGRGEGDRCASATATMRPYLDWKTYEERPLPQFEHRPAATWDALPPGLILGTLFDRLDLQDPDYLEKHAFDVVGEPSSRFQGEQGIAHPAVLLGMANLLFVKNFQLGPWIHVSSEITNYRAARHGEEVRMCGVVAERFERKGHEFAVLDLAADCAGRRLLRVRHTAIYKLKQS